MNMLYERRGILKVILAPDSFKGSLTAEEAAQAMAAGISDYDATIETILSPVADGGEGTVKSVVSATSGKIISAIVQDPLGRKTEAVYGILGDEETCIIEIAEASGIMLLKESERNPLQTSTYGTGELIVHALDAGFRKFIIGLGGSATNDAGVGMLQALGMKFLNVDDAELLPGGEGLSRLESIDSTNFDSRISESYFTIASDVTNPLIGPHGASFIFGPQKGATEQMAMLLDKNLTQFANVVESFTGHTLHNKEGAGAAGGTGGAIQAFFPSEMRRGIDVVLDAISFENQLEGADVVITGEGKTDGQTLSGKTAYGIVQAAKGKPVILISGAIEKESRDDLSVLFTELHAIVDDSVSTEESMENTFNYLRIKTKEVFKSYLTD